MTKHKDTVTLSVVRYSSGLEPDWLHRKIQQAEKGVRKLKRHSPYIFQEWQDLQQAKTDLQKAKARYATANKRWKDLGSNNY